MKVELTNEETSIVIFALGFLMGAESENKEDMDIEEFKTRLRKRILLANKFGCTYSLETKRQSSR